MCTVQPLTLTPVPVHQWLKHVETASSFVSNLTLSHPDPFVGLLGMELAGGLHGLPVPHWLRETFTDGHGRAAPRLEGSLCEQHIGRGVRRVPRRDRCYLKKHEKVQGSCGAHVDSPLDVENHM